MSNNKYNLAKALSWYTIGTVLIKSINFLTLKLFTSLISTADFGVFGVFQSYLGIFEIIILLGTAHTIKMVKYDTEIDYERYVGSVVMIPIIGMVIMLSVAQICSMFTQSVADMSISLWRATFITAGFLAIASIISSKLILEGRYKIYMGYSLLNTVINISISLFLCYTVFKEHDTYWARVYGGIVSSVVSCIYLLFFADLKLPCIEYIKKGIIIGIPLLVHAIATQVLVQSDKIIISQLASYSSVGIYTVASNIVVIPNTLLSSIENSWSPFFFQGLSEKKYSELIDKNNKIIIGFALILCLFILAVPEIVMIISNRDYWDAVYVLIPLTIASFAELIYLIPLNLEMYYKKNQAIWIYTVSIMIFNIVFDILFIKLFGYLAGAYVTCVSRFGLFVLHYIRAKRIDNNDVLCRLTVIMCIIGLIVCSVITIVGRKLILVRIGMGIIVLGILVVYFKKNGGKNHGN